MKNILFFICILFTWNLMPVDMYAQTFETPDDFIRMYAADIKKIKTSSDGVELGKKAVTAIGISTDVRTFVQALPSSSEYEPVIQYIKLQRQVQRGPLTATYSKIVTEYTRHKASDQLTVMSNTLTNLARAASVFTILEAVYRDSQGDKKANNQAIAATYALISGELLSHYGLSHVALAVKPIDYALTTFMSTALRTNERLVFDAYKDYLSNKYTKSDWWQLYKSKDNQTFMHRLTEEFWQDSDRYLGEYMQRKGIERSIIDRTGRLAANPDVKNKFAKEYYLNNINNYIQRQKREALIQDRLRMENIMIDELIKAKEQAARAEQLKADLDRFKREMEKEIEYTLDEIEFIKILPQDIIIQKGGTVKMSVRAYLKNGESTNITEKCELPFIDLNVAGKKRVYVSCEEHEDETTWSVEVEPKLTITPGEYRFEINDTDKEPAFAVMFMDKYEVTTEVTDEAFENLPVHPNIADYTNAQEYPIYAEYTYEDNRYTDEAVVVVSGCEDPARMLVESSGECECDNERGFFENDEEECSKYSTIYLNPETVKGEVGQGYVVEVIGVDGSGKESVIHKLKVIVEYEGRNTYNMSHAGYHRKYTVIGMACPNERMEPDEHGVCKCKDEFIPDEGKCLTIEEIEQQARADGAGDDVDCDALINEVQKQHNKHAPTVMSKVASFVDHAELALKLLNDRDADPCNNSAFANSMEITKNLSEDLVIIRQGLIAGMAELWEHGGYQCVDMMDAQEALIEPMLEEMVDVQDIRSLLEVKWLEFNCKTEEIADLNPDLVNDPNRNPSGNVSGASGSDFPGDGRDNDGDGFTDPAGTPPGSGGPGGDVGDDNQAYNECLSAKGYTVNSLQNRYEELYNEFLASANAWGNNTDNEILCNDYKNDMIQIRELNQLIYDCLIEANIQDYPNGQQYLDATAQSISHWNNIIASLPC